MNSLLLIVDPQIDFINGSLPVPGAAAAMDALAEFAGGGGYAACCVTCDFHPQKHCSFAANGGQWPEHCVAHSQGAAIWPALMRALLASGMHLEFLQKGTTQAVEEYSIFKNELSREKLLSLVQAKNIGRIDVCGIAGDICVLNTLEDGVEILGPEKFHVLERFTPSLDGGRALGDFIQRRLQCAR